VRLTRRGRKPVEREGKEEETSRPPQWKKTTTKANFLLSLYYFSLSFQRRLPGSSSFSPLNCDAAARSHRRSCRRGELKLQQQQQPWRRRLVCPSICCSRRRRPSTPSPIGAPSFSSARMSSCPCSILAGRARRPLRGRGRAAPSCPQRHGGCRLGGGGRGCRPFFGRGRRPSRSVGGVAGGTRCRGRCLRGLACRRRWSAGPLA